MRASTQKISLRQTVGGYMFIMPNFLGFLVFTSLPVLASFFLSFYEWDVITPWSSAKFVWFKNFVDLMGFHRNEAGSLVANDPNFWYFFGNTMYLMVGIPIQMAASLFLAVLMNKKLKGVVFFRTIYFLPSICSGVALLILWRWVLNPDFGLLNSMIQTLSGGRITGPNWLTSVAWAKPALILMGTWSMMGGYNMILYLAALQGIPMPLYEAADIDGANSWQKFKNVTWPMLSPTTFFIFVMSIIGGFQGGFEAAYVMTGGGPAGSTTTISFYIYNNAYEWFRMGYAASIAWVLFAIIFVVTLFNWKYGGKVVHY